MVVSELQAHCKQEVPADVHYRHCIRKLVLETPFHFCSTRLGV